MATFCSWERTAAKWTKGQCLSRISEGAELTRAEISRVRIGGILSLELLGGAQELVGFPVQGLVLFFLWEAQGLVFSFFSHFLSPAPDTMA